MDAIWWFFIGPNHAIADFCGGGFAMTGTATMTLTSCPLLDPYLVFIVSELSNLASPSNYMTDSKLHWRKKNHRAFYFSSILI